MYKNSNDSFNKDKCELCGEYSNLVNSHLMPKSLYKVITKSFEPFDSAPIYASVSNEAVYYTNLQITKKALCPICEDRFNECGEKYVVGKCQHNAYTFDLRKALNNSTPSIFVDDCYYFNCKDIGKINTGKFMYFVASIIWRVTAINWRNKDIEQLYNKLPQEYLASLKSYLLGESLFPNDIYISVCVDNDDIPTPILTLPSGDLSKKMHISFFIPGIKFNVYFGKEVDQRFSKVLNSLGINLIYMYRSFTASAEYMQMKDLLNNKLLPKGKLAKSLGQI
ncbi:hypothetical protein V9Y53_22980 [Klebsiella pneumoniae]|uniref:hypothetical protein n=1 Tax=Klebsiella pneumoniae TaxID=573 RepID=UPI00312DF172